MKTRGLAVLAALAAAVSASCAGWVAETEAYEMRNRSACEKLLAPPTTLVEKIVKKPSDFPYEAWSAANPTTPRGSLLRSEIKGTIDANILGVRECYLDALVGYPETEGRVTVRFGIGPSGSVDGVAVVSNSTGVEPLGCCIARIVHSWTFRSPEGGGPVIVTYPFNLQMMP